MQVRQFFVCLVSAFFLLIALPTSAQKIVTNQNGDKIVIFEDGSWRYYEGEKDVITEPVEQQVEEGTEETEITYPEPKLRKKKEEKVSKKDRKKKKRKKKERVAKVRKTRTKKTKSRKGKTVVDPVADEESRREAILYAERATAEEQRLGDEYSQGRLLRIELDESLKRAQTDVNSTVEDIIDLEERLKKASKREDDLLGRLKIARKNTKVAERLITMPMEKRDKTLAKLKGETPGKKSKKGKKKRNKDKGNEEVVVNKKKDKKSGKQKKMMNVMLDPPPTPCSIASEGVDEFSGRSRTELEPKLLFSYTSERLRSYLKDRNYITCMGSMTSVYGVGKFLNLEFVILSDRAQREFGVLDKGSVITVKFIDGTTVRLSNNKTDIGYLDKVNQTVTYRGQYNLTSSQEKFLSKEEVDRIRIVWGTGYEDYEIYELDFFSDQLRCLNQ